MRVAAILLLSLIGASAAPQGSLGEFESAIKTQGINLQKLHEAIEEASREEEEEVEEEDQDELNSLRAHFEETHNSCLFPNGSATTDALDVNAKSGVSLDLFEGDVLLSEEQLEAVLDVDPANPRKRRQALSSATRLWTPMGAPVIPYRYNANFPASRKAAIQAAMQLWEKNTCVRFRPASASDTSIMEIQGQSNYQCYSSVGKNRGVQPLHIGLGCESIGTVAHEMSHTLGTFHVQSRSDRDSYVYIDNNNVQQGMGHNFQIESNGVSLFGIPYEFGSFMHYHPYGFQVDKNKPTIYARQAYSAFQDSMGGPMPTFYDILLVNKLYQCDLKCPTNRCQNNGVPDVNNCAVCRCPKGWAGQYCNQRPANARIVKVPTSGVNQTITLGQINAAEQIQPDEVYYIFEADAGRKIDVSVNHQGRYSGAGCQTMGVELITTTDTRSSGIRECSFKQPTGFRSQGNSVVVWAYRFRDQLTTTISAKAV